MTEMNIIRAPEIQHPFGEMELNEVCYWWFPHWEEMRYIGSNTETTLQEKHGYGPRKILCHDRRSNQNPISL